MLRNGYILEGKYEILRQVGQGATARVYLAMTSKSKVNQHWCIKEIGHNIGKAYTEKALKEVRLIMELDHPAIPRIVEILEKDDATYIVMDYISGKSLAYILKENGPQPQEVVLEWGKQLCAVFEHLHSQPKPVIYHDLKPGNLILKERENNLKLIDFGEARKMEHGDAPGGGCTPRYAAPEQQQATRGKTDQRTDIYCFGTTLYRLLTGCFPPELPETIGSVKERMPQLQISNGMDNIIMKCTQPDPKKRFQDVGELKKALDNIEWWDKSYLKRQMARVGTFLLALSISILLLIGGIVFNRAAVDINARDYDSLVETTKDIDDAQRIQNYIEAIQMDGSNPRAYVKLLEVYAENSFGEAESQTFANLYNQNKPQFQMDDPEVLELNYQTGNTYFNVYLGKGESLRSRLQKAMMYFGFVVEHGDETYEKYEIASSYYTLCEFFTDFVLNANSTLEPTTEDYQNMLDAVGTCLDDMQSYRSGDAVAIRLTLCENLINMISSNARGAAHTGIEKQAVMQTLGQIKDVISGEVITQENNLERRDKALSLAEKAEQKITDEYANLERGT